MKKLIVIIVCTAIIWFNLCSCENVEELEYNYAERVVDIVDGKVNYNISLEGEMAVITIFYGCMYTNISTIRKILTHIITSPEGQKNNLSLKNLGYYEAEWLAHIAAYNHPDFMQNFIDMDINEIQHRSMHINLNLDDEHMNSIIRPIGHG